MLRILCCTLLLTLFAVNCKADQIVFSTGPDKLALSVASDGATGTPGFGISTKDAVADPFTLTSGGLVNKIGASLWVNPGDQPRSLDWAIATLPMGGGVIARGSVTPGGFTNTLTASLNFGGNDPDIYWSTFTIPDLTLASGAYWLIFTNGDPGIAWGLTAANSGDPSWQLHNFGTDTNPLLAVQRTWGTQSFELLDAAAPVPEPGSLLLMGSGLSLLSLILRRNFRRAQ